MIISKIFKIFNKQAFMILPTVSLISPYSQSSIKNQTDLIQKIQNATTFKTYFTLVNDPSNFSVALIVSNQLKLMELIRNPKQFVLEDSVVFLQKLKTVNKSQISAHEAHRLIRLVNRLQHAQGNMKSHLAYQVKSNFARILQNQIKNKELSTTQFLHELISYFQELCHDTYPVNLTIINKIYKVMHQQIKQHKTILMGNSYISILFDSFRKRIALSAKEHAIITLLFTQLSKNMKEIPLKYFVRAIINLNILNHYILSPAERQCIIHFHNYLIQKIPELDKFQINLIISCKYNPLNLISLKPVNMEIVAQLFSTLNQDGTSSLNDQDVFEFIVKCSNKVKLRRFIECRKKVIAFLVSHIKKAKGKSVDQQKAMSKSIAQMIQANFFDQMKSDLLSVINQFDTHVHINLLYELSKFVKYTEIQPFLQRINVEINTNHELQYLKAGLVYNHYVSKINNESLKKYCQNQVQVIQKIFNTPQKFKTVVRQILFTRYGCYLLRKFIQINPQIVKTINIKLTANPSKKQRFQQITYILFMFKCQSINEVRAFKSANKEFFTSDLLLSILIEQFQKGRELIPNYNLFKFINDEIGTIISENNKVVLKKILLYMNKHIPNLICGQMDNFCKQQFWRFLHISIIFRKEIINMNLKVTLFMLWECLINKVYLGYNYSPSYRIYLLKLLQIFEMFDDYLFFQTSLVKSAFPLNIIKPGMIKIKNPEFFKSFKKIEMLKYKTLQDKEYKIQCSPQNIPELIQVLISNKNSEKFLEENISIIQEALPSFPVNTLQVILVNMELRNGKACRQISKKTLVQLIHKMRQDQIDIFGIFYQCQRNFTFPIKQYSQLFEKYVQNSIEKIEIFEKNDPLLIAELAKFVGTQSPNSIKNINNFYELLQIWLQRATPVGKSIVYRELLNCPYPFKTQDLNFLNQIFSYNFYSGISFFLFLQEHYSVQKRQKFVQKIAKTIKNKHLAKEQINMFKIVYEYLKSTYPEIMNAVDVKDSQLIDWKFSYEPNHAILNALSQAAKVLNLKLEKFQSYPSNTIYKINKAIIFFPSPLKNQALLERKFIKKVIRVLSKHDGPIFDIVNTTYDQQKYLRLILREGIIFDQHQIQVLKQKSQMFRSVNQVSISS